LDREARFRFGGDIGAISRAYIAIKKWLLGEVGPVRAFIEEAVAQAIKSGHVRTLVHTICIEPSWGCFEAMLELPGATLKLSSNSGCRMRLRCVQRQARFNPLGQALG